MPDAIPSILILYHPQDHQLMAALRKHLRPAIRSSVVSVWTEDRVSVGAEWRKELERAIDTAKVALLLVSVDFIACDDFFDVEVPRLQQRYKAGKLQALTVKLRTCSLDHVPWLEDLRALPSGTTSIDALTGDERHAAFMEVAREVIALASPVTRTKREAVDVAELIRRKQHRDSVMTKITDQDALSALKYVVGYSLRRIFKKKSPRFEVAKNPWESPPFPTVVVAIVHIDEFDNMPLKFEVCYGQMRGVQFRCGKTVIEMTSPESVDLVHDFFEEKIRKFVERM